MIHVTKIKERQMNSQTNYHSSTEMNEIEDESVHLIVTSPPYPMIQKWDELFGGLNFDSQHFVLEQVWRECYRILIEGGICCINIGDATRKIDNNFQCFPNYAKTVMLCTQMGFTNLIPIFWKKISNRPNAFLGSGFLPPNAYISQDCEYIAIFRKGYLRKFKPKDENRYNSQYSKEQRDKWFQQIWEIPGKKGAKKTSAFPNEIPRRLISMFSVIGDYVVDPFSGTGTTQEECLKLQRNFIGYEIKERKNEK
jgi:site-specific DNA-methyltransferase (cytosine-N4-specific)